MNKKEMLQLSLMKEVASMYYEKGMTQEEIGKALYLSRTRISRILKKAEEVGVVEIHVNHILERNHSFEERIKQRFHLKEVRLYNGGGSKSDQEIMDGVVKIAAAFLKERINRKMVVGISWGNTIRETVEVLGEVEKIPIDIVQIMGFAATTNLMSNSDNIAHCLASKYGGIAHGLNSPLFVPDMYVKNQIMKDKNIAATLVMAARADMVLTSIGTLEKVTDSNPWLGYMTKEMFEEIRSQGAVGCLGARFFDRNGKVLDNNEWNRHRFGILLEDIRKIKAVVIVASGEMKADALLGAIRGGLVDTLISDSRMAEKIVKISQ